MYVTNLIRKIVSGYVDYDGTLAIIGPFRGVRSGILNSLANWYDRRNLYLPNKKNNYIVVTFLVSDLPSGYINIELLGEWPLHGSKVVTAVKTAWNSNCGTGTSLNLRLRFKWGTL